MYFNKIMRRIINQIAEIYVNLIYPLYKKSDGFHSVYGPWPEFIEAEFAANEVNKKQSIWDGTLLQMRPNILRDKVDGCHFCNKKVHQYKLHTKKTRFYGKYMPVCKSGDVFRFKKINGKKVFACGNCKLKLTGLKFSQLQMEPNNLILKIDLDNEYINIVNGKCGIDELNSWNTFFSKVFKVKGRECAECGEVAKYLIKSKDHHWRAYNCDLNLFFTVDHIIPKCAGGDNRSDNLQIMCNSCNSKKGGTVPRD